MIQRFAVLANCTVGDFANPIAAVSSTDTIDRRRLVVVGNDSVKFVLVANLNQGQCVTNIAFGVEHHVSHANIAVKIGAGLFYEFGERLFI